MGSPGSKALSRCRLPAVDKTGIAHQRLTAVSYPEAAVFISAKGVDL